jgi:ATP synthase F1 gamma subunit
MHLNELRKELKFNKELLNLVETLKNVAGSQYHQMEKEKQRFDRFMDAFAPFFRVVDLVDVRNPLVKVESDTVGLVIVTSDSGFMGGLNQGVVRAGFAAVQDVPESRVSLVVIGEKGASLAGDRKFKFFQGISHEAIYERALQVRDYVVGEVMGGRMGRLLVAHPVAVSFSSQTIKVERLLPCGELFDRSAESEVSARGAGTRLLSEVRNVVVESAFTDIAQYLASLWVASQFYARFEDSKLAEFSARAMHLEGSHQKVEKEFKRVKRQCSKASHELIDKGMRESFAAKSGKRKRERRTAAHAA